MNKEQRKLLTNDVLTSLFQGGITDAKIGTMFGLTGEGVAYRRKKIGLEIKRKPTQFKNDIKQLKSAPVEVLSEDYYKLTNELFSEKYQLSKTIWLPYLRSLGIIDKYEKRIKEFPPLTLDQERLIVAGLLGDGGIDDEGRYYEFHSKKQLQYLQLKQRLLRPYSKEIKKDSDGYRFGTVSHPVFKKFRELFYSKDVKGKLIPLEIISNLWDDCILAYWFFDDGSFDDDDDVATFANFCPIKEQLCNLADFLNNRYDWKFSCTKTGLFLPKRYSQEFGQIIARYATPDVYYKIPESCISPAMITEINMKELHSIKPKFYRTCENPEQKQKMEEIVFDYYRKGGFPYMHITEAYTNYLINEFMKFMPKEKNDSIMHNTAGQNLCENFFPNIYECHRKGYKSPLELWQEDNFLKKLVKNRLQHADRLTPAAFRTGIKLTKACVSNFKPAIAKYLYSEFCKNGKILDYSCGFGSRMLAAMSLGMEYSGFEPAEKTYTGLLSFGEFLKKRIGGQYEIRKEGSEESVFRQNYFGFAFSSPPYFDFEHYSNDPGQSLVKYPQFDLWLKNYWFKTMQNCYEALIPEGFFGICLSSSTLGNLFDETFSFAKKIGFYFYKDFAVPFKHVLSGGNKSETILIFSKFPTTAISKVYRNSSFNCKFSIIIRDDLMNVSGVKRKIHNAQEIEKAINKFKEVGGITGVSRDTYKDGSLGVPSYVLEHKFGSWNKFIRYCGFNPIYEIQKPVEYVKHYLHACIEVGEVLSFYGYEKRTGIPSTRLKRLFNVGKPFHYLRGDIIKVALHPDLWPDFLDKIK